MATKKKDNVYWVVMTREFFTWKARTLWSNERLARHAAEFDFDDYRKWNVKVDRVELIS